jgi:nucleoside-triphosphatase
VVAVAASFSSRIEIVAAAAVLACLVAFFADRSAFRSVLRAGLVVGAMFAAAIAGAAVALASGLERGALVGAAVLLRIVVLATAAALVARSVDADAVVRATSRLGLERLGMVFGLALNCLPHLSETAAKVWSAHRVRSGGRAAALARMPLLAEVLLAHTGRVADRAAAAAALRGHASLGAPRVPAAARRRTVVITGAPGTGKTPLMERVAEALADGGIRVTGFVQPAIVVDGVKVGFRIRDLATGESSDLARRVELGEGAFGTSFVFRESGLDLGRRAIGRTTGGDLLCIDELGPVELRGGGHWPAVERVLRLVPIGGLVVVVRRALVPALVEALDAPDVVVVDAGDEAQDCLATILEVLRD